jgi:hypothetical protein
LNLVDGETGVSPVQPGGDARRSTGGLGSTRHPFDVIPSGEQSFGLASFDLAPVRLNSEKSAQGKKIHHFCAIFARFSTAFHQLATCIPTYKFRIIMDKS